MLYARRGVALLVVIMWNGLVACPVQSKEPRDPFVDPRQIVIPQTVRPKLMGVVTGSPSFVIVGEAVATVGDEVGGWQVVQVPSDGAVFQQS